MAVKKVFIAILFLCTLSALCAGGPYLYGEFVYNLNLDLKASPFEDMGPDEFEAKPGENYEEEVMKAMLEEARWVFSAMIYGLEVEYTPSDIAREVDRLFTAELLAEIPFGDPALEIYDTFLENNLFHTFIRYELNSYQERRIEYWNSGVFESGTAYGFFPYFQDESRINAIKDGIRIALENQLKPEVFNKPESIEAEVLLRESPSINLEAGQNRAFVKIRSHIKDVRHYRVNH